MPVKIPIPYAPYVKTSQLISISLKPIVENLQTTPTSLPTAEPSTSQWVRALTANDFPVINTTLYAVNYVALVYVAGRNTDTTARTVYWRMIRNGTSVATGSTSVSAGNYYTVNAAFHGVVVGDVIEVRLWASATTVNWDYDTFQIHPTRISTAEALNNPCYVDFKNVIVSPILLSGTPGAQTTGAYYPYHLDLISHNPNTPFTYDLLIPKAIYRLYRIHHGDVANLNTASVQTHASYRPYYIRHYVPILISLVIYKLW